MNLFYTSSIALALMSFLLGLIVYLKDRNNNLSRQWFILSTFISGWAILLYLVASSVRAGDALNWQYLLDVVALGIPVAYFNFVVAFLNLKIRAQVWIFIAVSVLLSIFSTTTLFKVGVIQNFGFYWINPGEYYFVFPLFFLVIVTYSLFLLIRAYMTEPKGSILRSQIIYQLIAGSIGFSGGATNFLPQLFNIFPFGNYFVIIYIFFVSYSILKYQLFNLKLILVELAILLLNLFLIINIFISHAKFDLLLNVSVFTFILAFSVILIRGIYKDIRDRERIEGLAREMEVANERLRAMEQQKTEFVSIASHQLRTPITVIKGYASMILEGTFGVINDVARDAMENLFKSSEKIVALVDDLLTVSRIEQGRMMLSFEPVNLKSVVQKVLTEMQSEIDEAKINLSLSVEDNTDFFVAVDEKKFKQVIHHILDNAIKYTPQHGAVRVTIVDDTITDNIRLIISDTGEGMNEEQISAIFERFDLRNEQTGYSENNEHDVNGITGADAEAKPAHQDFDAQNLSGQAEKGTHGIGLYIAQEIITAHHGKLSIESDGKDMGTSVTVEMPRANGESGDMNVE